MFDISRLIYYDHVINIYTPLKGTSKLRLFKLIANQDLIKFPNFSQIGFLKNIF